MLFSILKSLHVLGAVLFLGVGAASAWYKLQADRSDDPRIVAWGQHQIVRADALFTVPSALIMPITGLWMVHLMESPLTTPWIAFGLGGFAVAGVLWLPAVWLQLRMRDMADAALASGEPLPAAYWQAQRVWLALGAPAFALTLVIIWVMVTKHLFGLF